MQPVEEPARATAAASMRDEVRRGCAGTRGAQRAGIMKTKKTLKLSFETLRRLDLDAANGGAVSGTGPIHSVNPSCGIVCTIGPNRPRPPMHSLQPSCGIVCTIGPNRPTTTRPSVGIMCA
jgi:hypothetical protein